MYIGVTIGLQKEFESIWINGIKMNAIFLVNVLKQTGHKVVLLDTSQKIKESVNHVDLYCRNKYFIISFDFKMLYRHQFYFDPELIMNP